MNAIERIQHDVQATESFELVLIGCGEAIPMDRAKHPSLTIPIQTTPTARGHVHCPRHLVLSADEVNQLRGLDWRLVEVIPPFSDEAHAVQKANQGDGEVSESLVVSVQVQLVSGRQAVCRCGHPWNR